MTTLKEQLRENVNRSLKAHDELRTSTLRYVLGEIQREEKAGKVEQSFNDEQVQALLTREVKKRRATAEEYTKLGKAASDKQLAASMRELQEAAIIEAYLPKQLSEEDIDAIVAASIKETGAVTIKDMGRVMKSANAAAAATGSRADGQVLSGKVREALAAIA